MFRQRFGWPALFRQHKHPCTAQLQRHLTSSEGDLWKARESEDQFVKLKISLQKALEIFVLKQQPLQANVPGQTL